MSTAAHDTREPWLRLRDNPLLIALAQRRLRWKRLLPGLIIVVVLGLCALLLGWTTSDPFRETKDFVWKGLVATIVFGQGLFLFLWAPIGVSATLSGDRRSGMLDFHRAAPTSAWTNTLGYLVGGAALPHVLAAAGIPFLVIAGLLGGLGPLNLLTIELGLWLSALLYHALGLLVAVLVRPGRAASGGAALVVMALLVGAFPLYSGGLQLIVFLTPYPAVGHGLDFADLSNDFAAFGTNLTFFGAWIHPLLATLLVQGSLLLFVCWAVARRVASDDAPVLSRPGAFAFLAVTALLLVAASWKHQGLGADESSSGLLVYLTVLLVGSAGVIGLLSPDYLRYRRALRRARREGLSSVPWLRDNGENWPVWLFASAVLIAGYVAMAVASLPHVPLRTSLGVTVGAMLVSLVALLGFLAAAVRWARFVHRRAPVAFMMLILFVTLVLPWMLWAILTGAETEGPALFLVAVDPAYASGASIDAVLKGWDGVRDVPMEWLPWIVSLATCIGLTLLLSWFTTFVAGPSLAAESASDKE